MAKIPIALQVYSIREDAAKDTAGVLAAVGKMGYDGVEFAGYYDHSAQELRQMLDDSGLKCCGSHLGIDTLQGDEFAKTVEFSRTLGSKYLIVPGLPGDYTSSRQAWLDTAKLFNDLSAKAAEEGMLVGYHNHHTEFTEMDGEMPWDTFFGNTNPEVVMQVDTGNALHGGADPVPFVSRYPGRAKTVHLKEYSTDHKTALIGEGDTNWDEFFKLCETVGGTEWYIVEQESYAFEPMVCVEKCIQKLRAMGK